MRGATGTNKNHALVVSWEVRSEVLEVAQWVSHSLSFSVQLQLSKSSSQCVFAIYVRGAGGFIILTPIRGLHVLRASMIRGIPTSILISCGFRMTGQGNDQQDSFDMNCPRCTTINAPRPCANDHVHGGVVMSGRATLSRPSVWSCSKFKGHLYRSLISFPTWQIGYLPVSPLQVNGHLLTVI